MFILTSLFFYCSTAKADDSDSNVIELYDYETGQTSNISISDYSINFLPAGGIIVDTPIQLKLLAPTINGRLQKESIHLRLLCF